MGEIVVVAQLFLWAGLGVEDGGGFYRCLVIEDVRCHVAVDEKVEGDGHGQGGDQQAGGGAASLYQGVQGCQEEGYCQEAHPGPLKGKQPKEQRQQKDPGEGGHTGLHRQKPSEKELFWLPEQGREHPACHHRKEGHQDIDVIGQFAVGQRNDEQVHPDAPEKEPPGFIHAAQEQRSPLQGKGGKQQEGPGSVQIKEIGEVKEIVGVFADQGALDSPHVIVPEIKPDAFHAELVIEAGQSREDQDYGDQQSGIPAEVQDSFSLAGKEHTAQECRGGDGSSHRPFGEHGQSQPGKPPHQMVCFLIFQEEVKLPEAERDQALQQGVGMDVHVIEEADLGAGGEKGGQHSGFLVIEGAAQFKGKEDSGEGKEQEGQFEGQVGDAEKMKRECAEPEEKGRFLDIWFSVDFQVDKLSGVIDFTGQGGVFAGIAGDMDEKAGGIGRYSRHQQEEKNAPATGGQ